MIANDSCDKFGTAVFFKLSDLLCKGKLAQTNCCLDQQCAPSLLLYLRKYIIMPRLHLDQYYVVICFMSTTMYNFLYQIVSIDH